MRRHALLRAANPGGIITLSDAFGDANGTNLNGSLSDQGVPWAAVAGSWTAQGGKAQSLTGGDSILALDAQWSDVDITADLAAGNAIYFRVVDADDWWRLRRFDSNYTNYCYTYQYNGNIGCDGGPCSPTWSGGCGGCSGFCSDCCICSCTQTGSVCSSYPCGSGTSPIVALERRVGGGSITLLSSVSVNAGTDKFRVVAQGDQVSGYRGASSGNVGGIPSNIFHTATSSVHQGATKHGVGYGSTDNLAHGIDNFVLTPLGV